MEPPLHLEIILPEFEPKAQDCFLKVLCGLTNGIQFINKFKWQEIFSVVGQYLDALICHYIFKDLSFWKSYQLALSAIRSDIQYIDSKCNEEALYSICEQYLHACWDEEEVIFVQYTHSTFFSRSVHSLKWYSVLGIHRMADICNRHWRQPQFALEAQSSGQFRK